VRTIRMILVVLCVLAIFTGCAGDGRNLDPSGNPIGSVPWTQPVAFAPTFTNVQQRVFDQYCLDCHRGASASVGLRLDAAHSYGSLIARKSSQYPQYFLVDPGNPDDSYLIRKLEGKGVVGAQMPIYAASLSPATIQSIRVWIANGAKP